MADGKRNWTVLFIGGVSGAGKSSAAYEIARFYSINVLEIDDIFSAVKSVTSKENLPNVHGGLNWTELGVNSNVEWLNNVSEEIAPALKAIVEDHIETGVPVIIEGDFITPEFTASFNSPEVRSVFITEPDKSQIVRNYYAREGGELQHFRAEICAEYGKRLSEQCHKSGISMIESRPWETVLKRITEMLH